MSQASQATTIPGPLRAVEIVRLLARAGRPLAAAAIARESGIPRSSTYEILRALVDAGYALPNGRGYETGPRARELGGGPTVASTVALHRLRVAARPVLAELRDATGETANLVVRDGDHGVYLDQVESPHALRHAGWAGRTIGLDAGAAAAALTGAQGPQVARDAVEVGVTAVACRVKQTEGPAAAVGVTGPSARMTRPRLDQCRAAVRRAAETLEEVLG